jgi:thioredoxin-related protein
MNKVFSSKIFIFFAIILLFSANVKAQNQMQGNLVKWISIEQADSLFKINPKPIFIDVYTEWCGWCKKMAAVTFSNKPIADYLNTNFYPVRFDAEGFDTIKYQGKTYTNPGGYNQSKHDFAKFILNGRYSFPTIVYIDRNKQINPVPGYMEPLDIEPLLVFFSEDVYVNTNFNDFELLYQFKFSVSYKKKIDELKPEQKLDTLGVVKWLNPQEA